MDIITNSKSEQLDQELFSLLEKLTPEEIGKVTDCLKSLLSARSK